MKEAKWELHDEKGHEIWHASLDGSVLTIVSGPIDGKQKTQTKDHGDEAKAQKAFVSAMKKQQKAGFHDPAAPWPLPVVTDDIPESDSFMMFILPEDRKRSYRVRLIDIIPAHLAKYHDKYGSFFEGPKNSHFWFKNRVHVGRGHFIRPVEPPMNGDTKDFPLAYSPEFLSARPDGESVILAYKTTLYEVEIETGAARLLHTFADVATLRGTRRFRYAPDGVNVLWRDLTQKDTIVRLKDGVAKPWLETTGEILDFRRLADGSIALITENFFERWVEESGLAKRTHQLAVRKGWGLGTWLDGKVVLLFTRSPAETQTYYLGVSEHGLHLMGEGRRRLRWADEVRGTQWCVESMPGGDVDGNVCRMYNVQNVYEKSLKEPALAADHVFERPSLHDALAGSRDFPSAELVEKAIKMGADLEARSAHGWPPLAYAAWLFDRTDLVQALLDAKCDLQACDHNGLNALANALLKGHLTVAKLLLEAGVECAAQGSVRIDRKEVRLHAAIAEAAGQGAHEIVEMMLERGADPSATDGKGYTPVSRALLKGHEELADLLLKAGGKVKSQAAENTSLLLDLCRSVPHRVTEFTEDLKVDIVGQPGANALHYYLAEEWLHGEPRELVTWMLDNGAHDGTVEGLDHGIGAGNTRALKASLDHGADPNGTQISHNSPNLMLHRAICSKRPSLGVVEALIDAGAKVESLDSRSISALRYAIARLPIEFTELLLKKGAPLERGEGPWGPLHEASWADKAEIATLLLERGAPLEETTADGRTPLTMAAQNNKNNVFDLLLDAGADPNGGALVPLFGAALANNKHAALRLLERNADATAQVVNPWNKDVTDALTIQQHAERANANDVVELLLERGGTISTIHGAAKANNLEALKALLDAGADINEGEPERGSTALHLAKSVEVVQLLIERGADVNRLDRYEYSAGRVFAAQADTDETIAKLELLFEAGLDPNGAGWRTLHSAISSGKKKIAKYLIDRGVPVDSKKKWVKQPLHVAAEFDQVELAELLLDKGANIHAWAYNIHGGGDTPLHVAAQYNGRRVAELLLKRGADASLHDGDEDNWDSGRHVPIHHAVLNEAFEMVCILLRHGVGVYEPLRGRDLTEISEDHPEIHELVCAVLDDDMTVDEFLAKKNEVQVLATAYDSEGVFWVERIEQKIPDGTGLASPAVKKAMRVSDWVRTPPGMKYSLVLRLEHAKYRAYVGDETGMHTLPVVIAGKSLHYLAGPDDGYFLLSDFDNVYFVNAETRSVDRLLEAKDLGSKLAGMGRTSLGFLLNLESDLRHYRWAPGELPELLWKIPKGNLSGLSAFGAPLVGLSFADRSGEVVWAVADEAGLRLHSRLNEPLVLTWSRHIEGGLEAVAYTAWSPPVKVLRLHHLDGVTSDSEPIKEMPTLKERDALPLCTYRS